MDKHRVFEKFIELRWSAFILANTLVIALLLGNFKLTTESDYRIFFDKNDPNLLAHESIESEYTKSDNITFIISAKDRGRELFNKKDLSALIALTESAWQIPYALRVDSVTNYQYSKSEDDEVYIGDLVNHDDLFDQNKIQNIRNIAISEVELVNRIIASDAKTTSITIILQLPFTQKEAEQATFEAVSSTRVLLTKFKQQYPDLEFRLVGQSVVIAAFAELTRRDLGILFPIMLCLSFVFLTFFLRSFSAALITFFILTITLISTFGLAGHFGYSINQVNAVMPIIVLTITICNCVHLFSSYYEQLRNKISNKQGMITALSNNFHPIFLTTLTTMIGFSSMNFSDSPPFRSLGSMTAAGVGLAFVFCFCTLPALGILAPTSKKNIKTFQFNILQTLNKITQTNTDKILIIGGISTLILALCAFNNEFNDNTIGYFKKSVPIREAADYMQAHLTGFDMISYSLDTGIADGINNPDYLEKVNQFASWYKTQPGIVSVISYTDILKRLNKNMHNDQKDYYKLPSDRQLTAQYQLLYELSLPYGLDLNNLINTRKSALKITAVIKGQKAEQLIQTDLRAQQWLAENAPSLQSSGAGISLLFAHIGQNNIRSMVNGVLFALLLITLTLAISFRSVKIGLLTTLPNALPGIIALGIWGIFISEVNIAVATILSITMGIVVDDTIHLIYQYINARKNLKLNHVSAMKRVYSEVGSAILVTSFVLTAGFTVLCFSDFNVNAHMGLMVTSTIIIALFFDLIMLPAFLTKIYGVKSVR